MTANIYWHICIQTNSVTATLLCHCVTCPLNDSQLSVPHSRLRDSQYCFVSILQTYSVTVNFVGICGLSSQWNCLELMDLFPIHIVTNNIQCMGLIIIFTQNKPRFGWQEMFPAVRMIHWTVFLNINWRYILLLQITQHFVILIHVCLFSTSLTTDTNSSTQVHWSFIICQLWEHL